MSRRSARGLTFLIEERPVESFEQLDSALRIVTVRGWLLLAVVFVTLGSFGVFAWFYRAPLKVDGRGIILARDRGGSDAVLHVTAPATGRITEVRVAIGQEVDEGDLLARIDQGELEDRALEIRAEIERLRREDLELEAFEAQERAKKTEALDKLEDILATNRRRDETRLVVARQIDEAARRLNARGMLDTIETLKSRADADAVAGTVGTLEAQLQSLQFDRVEDENRRARARLERRLQLEAAETRLRLLEERITRDTEVRSPYAGTVVDLMMTDHALIEKGEAAALLQPDGNASMPMEAIVFVPAGLGKKVRKADPVEVTPDTVRRQEHGYIRGLVRAVSEIPATEMAMLAELKHRTLVSSFLEQYRGQALLCLHVALPPAPRRRVGPGPGNDLDWSSRSGRDQVVSTGTLCTAAVVVETRPLITLALPWVKELVGLY